MITGILLAAGAGSRFGGDKLLFPLDDGTPLGVKSGRNLLCGVDRAIAVVRPADQVLARLYEEAGLRVTYCPGAAVGMGGSLACGVRAAPDADGWLIALADMPFIRADTIHAVTGLLRAGAALAAPSYYGRRGHPVGFAQAFFNELTSLGGDRGASSLLAAHASSLQYLDCDDPGILIDIDNRSDLVNNRHAPDSGFRAQSHAGCP
ncbi:MAG: nucleotidyltransferase family protein [Sulfuricella sp.]